MVLFTQGINNSVDLQIIVLIWIIKLDARYMLGAVSWRSESGFIKNASESSFHQVCYKYPIILSNRNQLFFRCVSGFDIDTKPISHYSFPLISLLAAFWQIGHVQVNMLPLG